MAQGRSANIIRMIKWIRSSMLSTKETLSLQKSGLGQVGSRQGFLLFQISQLCTRGVEVEMKVWMGMNLAIERAVASLDAVRAIPHKSILAGAEERPGVAFRV